MTQPKVYIDGRAGTTGLQIESRLRDRTDIHLLTIPDDRRRDTEARRAFLNDADLVFLCLPDDGAREAVALIENPNTRVIDASTAHRTAPGWVYGFPELTRERRAEIRGASRIANPGCHATGFIAVIAPLIAAGAVPADSALSCFSLTGYSGGGKQMIAQYEDAGRDASLGSPRIYGLTLSHKHLPEMTAVCGLTAPPIFSPILGDYPCGMATTVTLHKNQLRSGLLSEDLRDILGAHYQDARFVRVAPYNDAASLAAPGFIESNALVGTNDLEILVWGNGAQTSITARFDNLGKGASGAAVQNMNLCLGLPEAAGL